jgi:hypothetical protein
MLKTFRSLLSAVLVMAVMSAGLPVYHPVDVNRDSRVDLADAILHMKDIARSAEDPSTFGDSLKDTVTTLHVVAGLKQAIKAERTASTGGAAPSLDSPYLVSSYDYIFIPVMNAQISEIFMLYHSIELNPVSPPPRV